MENIIAMLSEMLSSEKKLDRVSIYNWDFVPCTPENIKNADESLLMFLYVILRGCAATKNKVRPVFVKTVNHSGVIGFNKLTGNIVFSYFPCDNHGRRYGNEIANDVRITCYKKMLVS